MDKRTKIKFNILAVIMIMIFCFALTPKTLQNDTYYTIKIGEHIIQNGIDMKDPFSWHEDLPYTYPHWAYDLATYEVFQLGENTGIGGFTAIYVMTVVLAMILGVTLYIASNKICKNELIAFIVTLLIESFEINQSFSICPKLRCADRIFLIDRSFAFSKNFILSKKTPHFHNPIASHSMSVITYCVPKNPL